MPLHDHFHAPLKVRRHWSSFHAQWAAYLTEDLNELLPKYYVAEALAHFAIEIDVATWEEPGNEALNEGRPAEPWTPSAPQMTLPLTLVTDVVEVRIHRDEGGYMLAGAVELVSPSNKDRPDARNAFTTKCAAYVQQGIGLVVVDIVTERRAAFHRDLLARVYPEVGSVPDADLYAGAYHPMSQDNQTALQIWHSELAIGGELPTLPLWLRGGACVPLHLEATYERACRTLRISDNGE